jgi:hypothetical protein
MPLLPGWSCGRDHPESRLCAAHRAEECRCDPSGSGTYRTVQSFGGAPLEASVCHPGDGCMSTAPDELPTCRLQQVTGECDTFSQAVWVVGHREGDSDVPVVLGGLQPSGIPSDLFPDRSLPAHPLMMARRIGTLSDPCRGVTTRRAAAHWRREPPAVLPSARGPRVPGPAAMRVLRRARSAAPARPSGESRPSPTGRRPRPVLCERCVRLCAEILEEE